MKKTNETPEDLAPPDAPSRRDARGRPRQAARKPRGRPLSFDRDAALETAMHVFWERGYEAASISDLTSAMGITPPSLYTAFGDKEQLFLEAIERYALGYGSAGARALDEEPTARGAIERWLLEAADELTQPCHPKGCMVVMAATNCSAAAERVQDALLQRRTEAIANVRPPHPGRHRQRRAAARHRRQGARELLRHHLPGHVDAGQGRRHAREPDGHGAHGDAVLAAGVATARHSARSRRIHPCRAFARPGQGRRHGGGGSCDCAQDDGECCADGAHKRKSPHRAGFCLPDNVTDHEDGLQILGDGFPMFRPMCGRFCTCDGLIMGPLRDSSV